MERSTARTLTPLLNNVRVKRSRSYEEDASHRNPGESTEARIERINNSQIQYAVLFENLNSILGQLKKKYCQGDTASDDGAESEDFVDVFAGSFANEDSDETDDAEDEIISSAASTISATSGASEYGKLQIDMNDSSDYEVEVLEVDEEEEQEDDVELKPEYPKCVECDGAPPVYEIGPNGTQVKAHEFDKLVWSSSAFATRNLLSLIFTSDILATHTLTGKPSPAFHGRERPAKMKLDALKVSDIIYCVVTMCGGGEREVRAAITTKCADTAKKYKRRLQKSKF